MRGESIRNLSKLKDGQPGRLPRYSRHSLSNRRALGSASRKRLAHHLGAKSHLPKLNETVAMGSDIGHHPVCI